MFPGAIAVNFIYKNVNYIYETMNFIYEAVTLHKLSNFSTLYSLSRSHNAKFSRKRP